MNLRCGCIELLALCGVVLMCFIHEGVRSSPLVGGVLIRCATYLGGMVVARYTRKCGQNNR